jgi:hypothetical protein
MDERQSFRRAFLAGLLTLGVALAGQMATSKVDASPACALQPMELVRIEPLLRMEREAALLEPRRSLTERVARAVIGAVLNGFA